MPAPLTSARLRPISATHPAARRYLLARRHALPRDDRVMAVSGLWAHQQLISLSGEIETLLYCPAEARDAGAANLADELAARAGSSYEISARTLARLHPGAQPPGLLSVVPLPRWSGGQVLQGGSGLVLVADGIEYAGNLGALLRTVDASGADGLILTSPVARLTHPTVFSASRGTVLTTPTLVLADVASARGELEAAGFQLVVADPDAATDFRRMRYGGGRTAFVVGSEGSGVSAAWRDAELSRVSISMRGRADSLNVATAAAILLFDRVGRVD